MSDGLDRRASPRFVCELRAYVQRDDGQMTVGTSVDLSRRGIAVVLSEPLECGMAVQLYLRLVLGWTSADFLTLPGRVVRVEPKGTEHRVAIDLDDLPPATNERLELLIRVLDGELDAVLDHA